MAFSLTAGLTSRADSHGHRPHTARAACRRGGRGREVAVHSSGRRRASPKAARAAAPRAAAPGALGTAGAADTAAGLGPELKAAIDRVVSENKVVVFMKGTKSFPACGFSNTVVQILNVLQTPFESVNVLENDQLRQGLKIASAWPTFPQVYINGEFYGGCDIMIESYQSGELVEALEAALAS